MAEQIFTQFRPTVNAPSLVTEVVLIPSRGGVFDVRVDGDLIFSKHEIGRHAEPGEVLAAIKTHVGSN